MFSTLFAIFIAVNVISTIVILAACVVSGNASRRLEMAESLSRSRNVRMEMEYPKATAASPIFVSHA